MNLAKHKTVLAFYEIIYQFLFYSRQEMMYIKIRMRTMMRQITFTAIQNEATVFIVGEVLDHENLLFAQGQVGLARYYSQVRSAS